MQMHISAVHVDHLGGLTVSGLSLVMLAFWFRIEPTFGGRAMARPEPLPDPTPRV